MCNKQAPSWLTEAYLQNVLQVYLKDNTVQIRQINIAPATAGGENYASLMARVRITFNTKRETTNRDLSCIIKYPLQKDPFVLNLMNDYRLYQTEMRMYEQILPQLDEILRELGDREKLFAHILKVDSERSALIFEDLSVSDYVMANRKLGLDERHARLVMRKLAKFHAAAAVLNERLGGALQSFDRGMFNRHTRSQGCIFEYFTEAAAKFALDCPKLGQYYCDKLLQLSAHIVDYATTAYASNPKHFLTLCHGDLWINNMLMLYDRKALSEDSPKDLMLIDFQLCTWSSATVDLHYFFTTSLETKLLMDISVAEGLVQYYHSVLTEILKKLGYRGRITSLHELCVQMEETGILAVTGLLANRSIATAGECDDADIYSLLGNDEKAKNFRRNCLKNKDLQQALFTMLPYFDRHGLLDLNAEQ